jgi:hypothetical protein
MLVVWDAKTGIPKKTIFDPHPQVFSDIQYNKNNIIISNKTPLANNLFYKENAKIEKLKNKKQGTQALDISVDG